MRDWTDHDLTVTRQVARIRVASFDHGASGLGVICTHPAFDYTVPSSAAPLVPLFVAFLEQAETQRPGFEREFHDACRYLLNQPKFSFERHLRWLMEFTLPVPFRVFLRVVWNELYPNEPWEHDGFEDVQVNWD